MWPRSTVYPAMLALLCGGFVGGWYGGDHLQAAISARGSLHPDGAAPTTMWESAYVDLPGVKVADRHCRGMVRLIVELGPTGPETSCGEPLRPRPGTSTVSVDCEPYLPYRMTVRRISVNGGPWRWELVRDCLSGIALPPPPRRS